MTTSEKLASLRTELANERTFLAYFRSFIVTLSSGLAILKLDVLSKLHTLGIILTIIAPIMLLLGLVRFFYTKRKMKKYHLD